MYKHTTRRNTFGLDLQNQTDALNEVINVIMCFDKFQKCFFFYHSMSLVGLFNVVINVHDVKYILT